VVRQPARQRLGVGVGAGGDGARLLPANRELVRDGANGLVVGEGELPSAPALSALLVRARQIGAANRAWVAEHGLFAPCIERLLARLAEIGPARR
jgi:hypothetical protein